MLLLGDVGEIQKLIERASYVADRVGRNRLEQRAQFVPLGAAAGARRFRQRADAFDAIHESAAAIRRDDAAEDFAQQPNVVAQCFIEV